MMTRIPSWVVVMAAVVMALPFFALTPSIKASTRLGVMVVGTATFILVAWLVG
jgi:hypothetical protein